MREAVETGIIETTDLGTSLGDEASSRTITDKGLQDLPDSPEHEADPQIDDLHSLDPTTTDLIA